jgi:MFS family permease
MKNKKLIVAALFLLAFYVAGQGILVPVLALIGKSLQVTNKSTLSLILTLPALFMIPMMLLSGALAARVSKKTLAYVAGLFFLIGGLGPIFTDSFTFMLVWRAILGVGCGIFFPLPYAMIPDYFEGPARHTMMGVLSAASSIWAAGCAVAAGIVGKVTWQHALYLYAFGIVPVLFVFFFLPNVKPERGLAAADEKKKSGAPAASTYAYAFALLLFFATIAIVANLISSFVVGEGMGSPTTAGDAVGVKTMASFGAALCFGPLFGFFKKWSPFVGVAIAAAGFVLLSISSGLPMLMISMIMIGSGMGFMSPVLMTWAVTSSPNAVSLALAITQVGIMLGMFASSLLQQLFAMIGGSHPRTAFLYSGVMLGGMAVVFLTVAIRPSKEIDVVQEEELVTQ